MLEKSMRTPRGALDMQPPEKKTVRSLEKNLMETLVDPPDGEQRRRYVKKWIYGEVQKSKPPKKFISGNIFP